MTPATLAAERRFFYEDRIQVSRLYLQWPTIGEKSDDQFALDVLGSILAGPRTARLTKALVYDQQAAASVSAYQSSNEDVGEFMVVATPRPGHTLTELEAAIDGIIEKLKAEGPTAEEVQKAIAGEELNFVRGLESNLGKAMNLAAGAGFHGDPGYYKTAYQKSTSVTAADVKRVANKYLTKGRVVLSVVPDGQARRGVEAQGEQEGHRRRRHAAPGGEVMNPLIRRLPAVLLALALCVAARRGPAGARPLEGPAARQGAGTARAGVDEDDAGQRRRAVSSRRSTTCRSCRSRCCSSAAPISSRRPKSRGVAAITAAMLSEGTKTRDGEALSNALQLLGTSVQVSVGGESRLDRLRVHDRRSSARRSTSWPTCCSTRRSRRRRSSGSAASGSSR